uniref:Ribosomal protein S1 n=1 Tax=Erythrotrichia carnea TaxID=35151 RepID=A0A1C9CE95_9RHOD|nr:ribosomal protein S1 [Erythrotrichia carnea]AOM66713.1 ribosomal protein S1 [Erythrotrichia carnea]
MDIIKAWQPRKLKSNSLKEVLQKYNYSLNEGDIVAGTIFSKEKHGLLINIGGESCAYLPKDETIDWKYYEYSNKFSETREFCIIKVASNNNIIVSIKKLRNIQSWERIKQLYVEDATALGKITKQNKGGLLVDVEGIIGFVPNSHSKTSEDINKIIKNNGSLPVKFLEINEKSGYLLLSYKRFILQLYNNNFNVGKVVKGKVTNIKPYGVFVDIGNASGLLHISEIADKHIDNLEEIFQIGNEILVSIIHLDTKQGRISLSTKFLN